MKRLGILLLVLFTITAQGQIMVDKLSAFYNKKQYDSIFYLFDSGMKTALPVDKTIEVLSGLYDQAGAILSTEYKKMTKTYKDYKAVCEKMILQLSISQNAEGKIDGLYFVPYKDIADKPVPARNVTEISLPFSGEWFVFWGGDTKEQNYHVSTRSQKNAFDIMMVGGNGKSYKTDGRTNEDYYAFGQPLTAPCDGEVVMAVDGVKDNIPGEMNTMFVTGNTVVIRTANNEYLLFAHFKQNSIKVKQGDKVNQGQLLGLCGNSGNSSEPHLHFHIQNEENMTEATGIKCFFEKLLVNGEEKMDYSPVKGERIKNMN
jgi:murein DD-endopeptidase MepM/ murein hydrolase activator NlpD